MRPIVRTALTGVVIVVVAAGGFVGGWYAGAASTGQSASSQTLWVVAAGSLAPILPSIASAFTATTPGVSDPISAQLYEGSTAAATTLAGGHQPYDLFVAADFRTIPGSIETPAPTVASWEVVFASDPIVLAYAPSDAALSGISSTNWWTKVVQTGVILGVPNASADPLGANAIFTLELQDAAAGLGGALYSHFFTGAQGALARPTTSTLYVSEDVAGTDLSSGEVDAFLIYRSYAVADHLAYVNLSAAVDLGGTTATNVSAYAAATTTVLAGTGTKVESAAPVLFALTVPSTAKSELVGDAFAAYLLGNTTASVWASNGFTPLEPAWTDHLAALPAMLSGSPPEGVAPLPSYLSALL